MPWECLGKVNALGKARDRTVRSPRNQRTLAVPWNNALASALAGHSLASYLAMHWNWKGTVNALGKHGEFTGKCTRSHRAFTVRPPFLPQCLGGPWQVPWHWQGSVIDLCDHRAFTVT